MGSSLFQINIGMNLADSMRLQCSLLDRLSTQAMLPMQDAVFSWCRKSDA